MVDGNDAPLEGVGGVAGALTKVRRHANLKGINRPLCTFRFLIPNIWRQLRGKRCGIYAPVLTQRAAKIRAPNHIAIYSEREC